jgi:hypothetical protein
MESQDGAGGRLDVSRLVGINVTRLYLIGLSFNLPLFRTPWPNQNDELTLGLNEFLVLVNYSCVTRIKLFGIEAAPVSRVDVSAGQ